MAPPRRAFIPGKKLFTGAEHSSEIRSQSRRAIVLLQSPRSGQALRNCRQRWQRGYGAVPAYSSILCRIELDVAELRGVRRLRRLSGRPTRRSSPAPPRRRTFCPDHTRRLDASLRQKAPECALTVAARATGHQSSLCLVSSPVAAALRRSGTPPMQVTVTTRHAAASRWSSIA